MVSNKGGKKMCKESKSLTQVIEEITFMQDFIGKSSLEDFTHEPTLPLEIAPRDKKWLESVGFEFSGIIEKGDDPIIQAVRFAPGWKKEQCENKHWFNLITPEGLIRAHVLYSPALPSKKSYMNMCRRYDWYLYDDSITETEEGKMMIRVRECEREILFCTEELTYENLKESGEVYEKLKKSAEDFLDTNFPDWKDKFAYW